MFSFPLRSRRRSPDPFFERAGVVGGPALILILIAVSVGQDEPRNGGGAATKTRNAAMLTMSFIQVGSFINYRVEFRMRMCARVGGGAKNNSFLFSPFLEASVPSGS